MTRLASGDRSAFHPVFEALWPVVRRFVSAQLQPAEADDVAQAALLKVFERAADFDPDADALSWALGIAAWQVRTARCRVHRRGEGALEPALALADARPSPEDAVIAADLERELQLVLGELRAPDLETLTLLARGERPRGPTFRKRVERSLARLRTAWSFRHGPR